MEKICERHNIPHKITLLGHDVEILFVDGLGEDEEGRKDWGQAKTGEDPMQILLHSGAGPRRAYQTFVHEIIELINNELELNMEHPMITRLEAGLSNVLLNNKIDWEYPNGSND